MQEFHINYLALLVAAAARIVVGGLWFSPLLFGRSWRTLVGCSEDDMKKRLPMLVPADFITAFVMAFVLVHAVHYAGAATASQGAIVGFFNWLGFVAVVTLMQTLYEARPLPLLFINNGFQLMSLLVMGGIVAVWA